MRYLITDPCYLIADEDWDILIEKADKKAKDNEAWAKCFDELITNFLREISGDKKAVASGTGIGDWVNSIDGQQFGADSGMVCVVKSTRALQKYLKEKNIVCNPLCVASLKLDGVVNYELDTSNPRWTIVKVWNKEFEYVSEEPAWE